MILRFEDGAHPPVSFVADDALRAIGRDAGCEVVLPDRSVSRRHAELRHREGGWELRNRGQTGTLVGGIPAPADAWVPLRHRAVVTIGPYRLRVDLSGGGSAGGSTAGGSTLGSTLAFSDGPGARVAAVPAHALESLAELRLSSLTDVASRLARADDEGSLEGALVERLVAVGDFRRAVVAERRMSGTEASWGVRAMAAAGEADAAKPFSQTLLSAALDTGAMVRLEDDPRFSGAESVMAAGTTAALAVPLGTQGRVLAVDTSDRGARRTSAAPFVNVVARLATLALESLSRRQLSAELADARRAQSRLLPEERGARGCVRWTMSTRPGLQVSGDLFAVLGRPDGGSVVLLGDVAGKGAPAGLVMAGTVAYAEAAIAEGAPLERVMQSIGAHVARIGSMDVAIGAFVTVFAFEIAPHGACRAVDAGHSLAVVVRGGRAELLRPEGGGPPLGTVAGFPYESGEVTLAPGDRIVLFSDGISEQPAPNGAMMGHEPVVSALHGSADTEEDVARLLALLERHAQGLPYVDDVTVASVVFEPS
jgi:serine phosphatase RsbU (regulator of sigma subunit)